MELPFEELLDYLLQNEESEFVEELITNMLIHQDFSISGYDPRIEIYNDRVEFTNSGEPIIDTRRLLDLNRSRNPKLAKLMRFLFLCEERGMGIDTVEHECEHNYLPSPSIMSSDGITRVAIFGHKSLRQFSSADRVNLVYMHCCLQYINQKHLTNESLRSRFSEGTLSPTVASRWISEAVASDAICVFDPTSSSRKNASYVPAWSK